MHKSDTEKYGGAGLVYKILFNERGFTPHYAEDVRDPTDNKQKLVMFDPHTRRSAFIYDVQEKEIEWEFVVPGHEVANPHQGFLLKSDIDGLGKAGDICCTDRNNEIVVIDRKSKDIIFHEKPAEWDPVWLHCVHLGADRKSLIVTDYSKMGGCIAKLGIPSLTNHWKRTYIRKPSKISTIAGRGLFHNPSFGGDYLICSNQETGPVYEVRDADGTIAWQNPRTTGKHALFGEGTLIGTPHSAFRLGRVECHGSITVIGSESGGGIIGVNFRGEPMFGLSQQFLRRSNGATQYYFNPHLLSEITHIFPTLTGRIGCITWSGHNSSLVGEIVRFPEKQEASYTLAFNRKTQTYFEDRSPIAAGGWDEIHVGIKNTGDCALAFEVIGYMTPVVLKDSHPHHGRFRILTGKIPAEKSFTKSFSRPFQFYVVRVKSVKGRDPTTYDVYVTKRSL